MRKKMLSDKLLSDETYRVERILGRVLKGKQNAISDDGLIYYEVKWVGFEETSLEPQTNPDIRMIVEKEEQKKGNRKEKAQEKEVLPKKVEIKSSKAPIVHYQRSQESEQQPPPARISAASRKTPKTSHKQMPKPRIKTKIPRIKPIKKVPYDNKRNVHPPTPSPPSPPSRPPQLPSEQISDSHDSQPSKIIRILVKEQFTQTDRRICNW